MANRLVRNTVAENVEWWNFRYAWPDGGDEWRDQAVACGVTYEEWKHALVANLIDPFTSETSTVLEIGPGYGRWTEYLAARAKKVLLVDCSPRCLDHCRTRFGRISHVNYYLTDGSSLPSGTDGVVDLVWSFDAFVHMSSGDIARYLREIKRVLVPGGKAVIHHGNRHHGTLWLGFLRQTGGIGVRIYRLISMGPGWEDGWRSNVSARLFCEMAEDVGLVVLNQISQWGECRRFGVPKYNDRVTILSAPV